MCLSEFKNDFKIERKKTKMLIDIQNDFYMLTLREEILLRVKEMEEVKQLSVHDIIEMKYD